MHKLITFRKLKDICRLMYVYESATLGELCCHDMHSTKITPCTAANCPVWARLTETPPTRKKSRCINAVDSGSCAKNDAFERDLKD